jgi:hypothetical protein
MSIHENVYLCMVPGGSGPKMSWINCTDCS